MTATVKGLVIAPGAQPELRDIPTDLDSMQALVGGYVQGINAVSGAVWHAYCNEEAAMDGWNPNPVATALLRQLGFRFAVTLGTVVFLGTKGSDEADVPEWIVATLTDDVGVEVNS